MSMGLFISFEGGEGTGKSSQAKLLGDRLASQGYQVIGVREPGGTELGDYLREYLKATSKPLTVEAELFLFVAARSEMVRKVLRPALEMGKVVVADRYADSTTVYQGYGRRLPMRYVRNTNELATGGLWPQLTVLLDAPLEVTLARARAQTSLHDPLGGDQRSVPGQERAAESGLQRFEGAGEAFHRRIREGYLKLAKQEPERWLALDASQLVAVLAELVWQRVARLLAEQAATRLGTGRLPGL